jgi:hypothetical protein
MDGRPGGGIIPLRVSDGSEDCIFKEISQLAIDEYLRRKQRRTFFKVGRSLACLVMVFLN